MTLFKNLKGIILDAGGVLIDITNIKRANEERVRAITDYLRSKDVEINTSIVRHVITDAERIEYAYRKLSKEQFFLAVVRTFLTEWDGMTDTNDVSRVKILLNRFEKFITNANVEQNFDVGEKSVLLKIQQVNYDLNITAVPPAYDSALKFLDYLKRKELKYVVVTDSPHSSEKVRQMIAASDDGIVTHPLQRYLRKESIIPSQEIGVLKKDSDLSLAAGTLLMYKGWDFYQSNILGNLSDLHKVISKSGGDLDRIAEVSKFSLDEIKGYFSATAGFFNNPVEFVHANNLGIRAFLCGYTGRYDVNAAWFKIDDLGFAASKLQQLEAILDTNLSIPNDEINNFYLKK